MSRHFACLIGMLLLLCPYSSALAEEASLPAVVVVGSPPEGWPPFLIAPQGHGPGGGIMLDVMAEVARSLGCESRLALFPEKRNLMLLSEGTIHAYPKAREWVDNPGLYLWSEAVVLSSDVIVFRQDNPLSPENPDNLTGLNLAVVHGFHYPALASAFAAGTIRAHRAKDTEAALRMLLRGHVDAVITNRTVAEWIIRNQPDLSAADFAFGTTPIDSAPYRFAFFKSAPWKDFAERFNAELAAMKRDGRLEAILDRYR